jgi:cyanate permease
VVPVLAEPRAAAPLAAGMFMVGYLLGFVVPLLGGIAADATGIPIITVVPLIALAALGVYFSVRLPVTYARAGTRD